MTDNSDPPIVQPRDSPNRYQPFYLTMLILSTIATAVTLLTLPFAVAQLPTAWQQSFMYGVANFASMIISLGSAVGLVLLWLKRPFGIWLKLSAYALDIPVLICYILTASPVISESLKKAEQASRTVDPAFLRTTTEASIYAGYAFGIVSSIVFGILWYFAWKKQAKADTHQ